LACQLWLRFQSPVNPSRLALEIHVQRAGDDACVLRLFAAQKDKVLAVQGQ